MLIDSTVFERGFHISVGSFIDALQLLVGGNDALNLGACVFSRLINNFIAYFLLLKRKLYDPRTTT